MRKRLLMPLMACMIALLSTVSISAVYATRPTSVSGTFDYTFSITSERWADGHYIFEATEWETWVGDFEGTAVSFFRVMWFKYPTGPLNVWLRSDFEGTVNGKEGTLVIQLVGWSSLGDWDGQWVIISGTGELANLHGQGSWGGPGFGAVGPDIWYSGQIHFD
jgi:Protein of unknown function (DUF3224)